MLRGPRSTNPKKNTPRRILVELTKTKFKGKNYEKQQGKNNHIQSNLHKFISCIFGQKLWDRRERQRAFELMKGRNLQARRLYPARVSVRIHRETGSFTDKQTLREFSTSKAAL